VADIEWVLLRAFADRSQAELLGEFLERSGVQASVEGAFSAGILPGVEGVRVMVPADRVEEARQAAEAFDGTRDDVPTPIPGS
jgi:putative signal transducing protein